MTTAPGPSAPPTSFSPASGPAFVVIDALDAEATLAAAGTATLSVSVVGPKPIVVLEGSFADGRSIGLFRAADLDGAIAACSAPALAEAAGRHDAQSVNAETLRPSSSTTAGRIAVGHHALGDDAPAPDAERAMAFSWSTVSSRTERSMART